MAGPVIALITVLIVVLVVALITGVADLDKWCAKNSDTGWGLLRWWIVRILRIIVFPIAIVLVVLGVYGTATQLRDWWHGN